MKIIFLDRDGVINRFPGNGNYVTKVKDFHFLPGALEAIRRMTEQGYTLFVVSNQAGVGKGVYSAGKLKSITRYMMKHVTRRGGKIKRILYCIHRSHEGCVCRKPRIGSIEKAMQLMNKSLHNARNTYFIGDTEVDIETGHRAGCTTIFVLSGRENRRHLKGWKAQPDFIAKDLLSATQLIEHENSRHPRLSRSRSHQGR